MPEQPQEPPTTYAVVGAGPMGLIAARALLRAGIDVEILERSSRVGGIWDLDNPGSPMYETCHFITSKWLGGFLDYKMPDEYPIYPHWHLVRDYIRDFARDYGIESRIRFGQEVVKAVQVTVGGADAWAVATADGTMRIYRGIVYAGGQQWKPYRPTFEGEDAFQGEIRTSNTYKNPAEFTGKKVVIVGAGNSGVDIAVDAAEYAETAYLSMRRAYHFMPKQLFGVPTPDLLAGKVAFPKLPGIDRELQGAEAIDLAVATVGDLTKYGLPQPTQPLGTTQPIVSDLALHCFSHGTLRAKPNIARFRETSVEFADGTTEPVDLVLFATGYDIDIPWLPEGAVDYEAAHPQFHLGTLALNVPNLYAIAVLHPSRADAWAVFDQLFQIAVADIKTTLTGENAANLRYIRGEYRPNLKGDFPFLDVRRNVNQVDTAQMDKLLDDLKNRFGIAVPSADEPGFYALEEEALV